MALHTGTSQSRLEGSAVEFRKVASVVFMDWDAHCQEVKKEDEVILVAGKKGRCKNAVYI